MYTFVVRRWCGDVFAVAPLLTGAASAPAASTQLPAPAALTFSHSQTREDLEIRRVLHQIEEDRSPSG